jgi:hypothetical protein
MKKGMSKRLMAWGIMITLLCLSLSSCSFFDQYTDKGKIKSSVNSYLSDIQSGVFTYDKFQSKYASDKAFTELDYLEEDAEIIMKSGMKKITYTVGDITADKGTKSGTCSVTISAVDVPKLLAGFGDHTPDFDEMHEAVIAQNAAMSEHTLSLSVVYDSSGKMWKVKDSTPLVEIIAKPYVEMSFVPNPTEMITLLFDSVKASDYLELEKKSESRKWSLPEDEQDKIMAKSMNSMTVFEIVADPVITDNLAEVKINVTTPDFNAMMDELMVDVEFWAIYVKPVILEAISGEEDLNQSSELDQLLYDEMNKRIADPSKKSMSQETIMELKFDEESESWIMTDWTYKAVDVFSFSDDPELPQEIIDKAGARALELLLNAGEITQAEYNQYLPGFQS